MTVIAGYQLLEPIHTGLRNIIYRAFRESDNTNAIAKTITAEHPTLEDITRLRHEYQILESLNIEGIVKTYGLENYQNGVALLLEDFGGESLDRLLYKQTISINQFLTIAIQLTSALAELHKHQIIHKHIKPHNIVINADTNTVKFIDFSMASRLERENVTCSHPDLLEGTLVYISPEQTGRMNRSIDYRTDFYSLGVTFYEMLTHTLPCSANTDALEVVHWHIAKRPVPPYQINSEIPEVVSNIIIKLLAKNAEDRYQSAEGLKYDLKICLRQLHASGKIDNFIPGQADKAGQLLIPQKLYGRENEVATLMATFERVASGNTELMLVSGYSGIGKTVLINEVHKPIVRKRGYFIAGKFDQFKRNIPFASLIQAFQSLTEQLLIESPTQIADWKEKLLSALGDNGQVIIDVIPEVELIIGTQQPVPELGATESQNRFSRVFKQFIGVFTTKEHPLVIFLDDLQWADSASLNLIEMLITDSDSKYLLLIGAYRDNEVTPTHPLIQTVEKVKSVDANVNSIFLAPLKINDVSALIADTLNDLSEKTHNLAFLLFKKTTGNPFFLTQLLKTLYQEKYLSYNFSAETWQWNIEQIQIFNITNLNVVELVAANISKLPLDTQKVLKLAACIGNTFNLDVLATVNEQSSLVTAAHLWSALQVGLILPLSNEYKIPLVFGQEEVSDINLTGINVDYKFLHDRVQQAAYSLIPDNGKKETHLKIGQLLLNNTPPAKRKENIFDVVNHLNIGVELITSQSEKDELAKLNLMAGKKAKSATAYEVAVRYLKVGIILLAENSWSHQYDLALNLYIEAIETQYLNTNFEAAASLAEIVSKHAKTVLDRIQIEQLKIQFYIAQSQMELAIDTSLHALQLLGMSLENTTLEKLPILPKIEDLATIPDLTDPCKLAALKLLLSLIAPAYVMKPELLPIVILTIINFCIENGHSPLAAYAYAWYGLLLAGAFGDIDAGYYSGQLALHLLEQFNAQSFKCKVYDLFYAGISPWKQHIKQSLPGFQQGAQSGLETGDIEWASYNSMLYCAYSVLIGEQLETAENNQDLYINLLLNLKQEVAIPYAKIWKQVTLNLLGKSTDKARLIGESFDETIMLSQLKETNNGLALFAAYQAKLMLSYLYKNYTQAVEASNLAAEYADAATGLATVSTYNFYTSLALLAHYSSINPDQQKNCLQQIEVNQEKMKTWASHAPMNFQHKYDLVEAEKARICGQTLEAMNLYDLAIVGAKENNYNQEEALANELAAQFYLSLGKEKIAKTYMTDAYYGYMEWGATVKVKDLESKYPQLITNITTPEKIRGLEFLTPRQTTNNSVFSLDLTTVLKASQAFSGEIVLDKLLFTVMNILLENAGAQKGFLLLPQAEQLAIVAASDGDKEKTTVQQYTPVDSSQNLPITVVNYVQRTGTDVVLSHAALEGLFTNDPYISANNLKSVLCTPILNQGKLVAILYLENNLTVGVFTSERLELLRMLSSQAAISLENALLYASVEQKVQERTQQLNENNLALEKTLSELKHTQAQLIQAEKMSGLGQMVAGIAHEINNPANFIQGNLTHASEYVQDLLYLIQAYQQEYPNPSQKIQTIIEDIELSFLNTDLQKLFNSMQEGTKRISNIVLSLRNFSRLDEAEKKAVDINEGIESTLLILQHRFSKTEKRAFIEVVKEYVQLPLVTCYAAQLNQVFMNVLNNAIDALEQVEGNKNSFTPCIRISTEVSGSNIVKIRIADNGIGMTAEVQKHIFNPFFTTKPVGSGTGLGLSVSYQIIVEKHGGKISCISAPMQGTEFVIEIAK